MWTTLIVILVGMTLFYLNEAYVLPWIDKKLFYRNRQKGQDCKDDQCPLDRKE